MRIQVLALALMVAGSSLMFAQETPQNTADTMTPRITKRQINQQRRIKQGVKSGELTPAETRRLEAQQAKIQADKQAAKADGKVTPQERRKLRREENRASRNIYRLKHNKRTAQQ